MKEEDKELLYIDICGRIPFGLVVSPIKTDGSLLEPVRLYRGGYYENYEKNFFIVERFGMAFTADELRPYLRTVEDMSKEELLEYHRRCICIHDGANHLWYDTPNSIDYLNKIHVDFRGLIPKGLAERATEEMYK